MRFVVAICALCVAAGCVSDQSRAARPLEKLDRDMVAAETRRHGTAGYAIAELFQSDNIKDKMRDTSGKGKGLVGVEFFHVEIAPDPTQPTALKTAGYIRRLEEDRGTEMLYEFYDRFWTRLAILGAEGDLYRVDARGPSFVGRFQLEDAAKHIYNPPSGYGYDTVAQDKSRVRMWDPEVSSLDARTRGVFHRGHRSAPPVLVMTRLRATEASQLAGRYLPDRFNDRELEALNRLRTERLGDQGTEENYGGLQYKDGRPVDRFGNPLHRGAVKD